MNVHSLEVAFENIFEKISGNVELLTELDQRWEMEIWAFL